MRNNNLYSKSQQYISYLLIFSILFLNTFQIPFFEKLNAAPVSNTELISIIVGDDVYSSIRSKIDRYAEDIQSKLPNTKALIYVVPVSSENQSDNISPQKIAALNEKLFFEGDGGYNSRLVGTILIGDVPLPVIHDSEKTFLSVYPYIDFNEKNFIYNQKTGFFEKTKESIQDPNPEIWHSIIAPNTGDKTKDKIRLNDFFDKDHSYYADPNGFLPGANTDSGTYVFYYDGKRDADTTSYTNWKGYELYIKYLEDLAYNRYSKHLADEISKTFTDAAQEESGDAASSIKGASPELEALINENLGISNTPDLSSTPDAMTKSLISNLTRRFFQIFNEKHIGDILKYVFNAGRYGDAKNVQVDTVISLVSKKDNLMQYVLKDGNTALEDRIDSLVKKGLSRNIALLESFIQPVKYHYDDNSSEGNTRVDKIQNIEYINYFYGKKASEITLPKYCSIERGSSLPVEANMGYNINTSSDTTTTLKDDLPNGACFNISSQADVANMFNKVYTQTYWGGNTVLNYDMASMSGTSSMPVIKNNRYVNFLNPIFDIKGSREISSGSTIPIISPSDCFNNNLILKPFDIVDIEHSGTHFKWPTEKGNTPQYSCKTDLYADLTHNSLDYPTSIKASFVPGEGDFSFEKALDKVPGIGGKVRIEIGGDILEKYNIRPAHVTDATTGDDGSSTPGYKVCDSGGGHFDIGVGGTKKFVGSSFSTSDFTVSAGSISYKGNTDNICIGNTLEGVYKYRLIPSYIEHKSPTLEEFKTELSNMSTPSLPIDKDRYIDFVSAKGNIKKIQYPNFFRIKIADTNKLNYTSVKQIIKDYLDDESIKINNLIVSENPSSLPSGKDKEVYDQLKVTGSTYPSSNVDLFADLSKDEKVIDAIVKSVLWYNLNSPTTKYKYILEHYLDVDGNTVSEDLAHKSDYEISYMGSLGDTENMYVKIDPENKDKIANTKIANALSKYSQFKNLIGATKSTISSEKAGPASFKCGPPDGVELLQWFPAIMCWLSSLVPPISINSGACSSQTLGMTDVTGGDMGFPETAFEPITDTATYNQDANKNGIPDGAELIKDGNIELASDRSTYSYNKTINVRASLLSSDYRLIAVDNYSQIKFELLKLEEVDGIHTRTIFDANSGNSYKDYRYLISKYISFNPVTIRSQAGIANFAFSSKGSDVNVVLRASINTNDKNGELAISKTSDIQVLVRGVTLDVLSSSNGQSATSFVSGEVPDIDFSIKSYDKNSNEIANRKPFTLKVINSSSQTQVGDTINFNADNYKYTGDAIRKAGVYKFEFTDSHGITEKKSITVIPGNINKLRVTPSSNQFVKGSQVDTLVELLDSNGNRTEGDLYDVEAKISGNGVFDSNKTNYIKTSTLNGVLDFKINSLSEGGNITLNIKILNTSISESLQLEVLDDAKIRVDIKDKYSNPIIVGKDSREITLNIISDNSGTSSILDKFNGVAYFDMPEINGYIEPNFVRIKNGVSEPVMLKPGIVSGRNIKIDVTVPGVQKIDGNTVTIFPDKPMSVGLLNSKTKMEADPSNSTSVKAILYDRYGNVTFNDSTHKVSLEIFDDYAKYLSFSDGSRKKELTLTEGVAKVDAKATEFPGTSYIYANVTPALESNSFIFKETEESSTGITISGISENAVPVDTYYFFNKKKLDSINYNAFYTALLGANYGDITHPGYLAGEMLFSKASKSLGVSSIINDPYLKQKAFGFTPGGKFIFNAAGSKDQTFKLEPKISTTSQGTVISLYDSVFNEIIARAWLNIGDDARLIDCGTGDSTDISKCVIPNDTSYALLKGSTGTKIKTDGNRLILMSGNSEMLSIDKSFKITKDYSITLETDTNAIGNILGIKVMSQDEQVGYIGIKFNSDNISVYGSDSFPSVLDSKKGKIVIEHLSSDYSYSYDFQGNSSHGAKGVSFYRTDDSSDTEADPSLVSSGDKMGFENYAEEAGIGWQGQNRMLLEFAGGNTLGESSKFYQTYSFVNLGDPVISLKSRQAKDSDFDKSIGKKLAEDSGEVIETYKKIDFNGDGLPDIVIFYESGKIRLLADYDGSYKDMGYLANVPDIAKGKKGVGDFEGDGYPDIAFVTNKGQLGILSNRQGKFSRITPKIYEEGTGKETSIGGAIVQMEIFDMDRDSKDDLVIVDDSGKLSILYGKSLDGHESIGMSFEKKIVDSSMGLKISSAPMKSGGALYFDKLPQLPEFGLQSQYLLDSKNLASEVSSNPDMTELPDDALKSQLDQLLYYQEKYSVPDYSQTISESDKLAIISQAAGTDDSGKPQTAVTNGILQSLNDLKTLNGSGHTSVETYNTAMIEKTRTYIRSQFAEANSVDIEKTYKDLNGGFLQGQDMIEATVAIKNNNSFPLNDIIYLDSNVNFMSFEDDPSYTITSPTYGTQTGTIEEKIDGPFSISFSHFNIAPNETAYIKYKLKSPEVGFGTIGVGILGDPFHKDIYGDITLNPTKGCGDNETVWESKDKREYNKIADAKPTDNSKNSKIVKDLEKAEQDYNFATGLLGDAKTNPESQELKDYTNQKLDDLKKDQEISVLKDADPTVLSYNSDGGITSGLGGIDVDAIDGQIDDFVNALGCGFGGGACITFPVNYAPLAPGSSPTLFGMPIAPNLMQPTSGLPIFSMFTGMQMMCGPVPCCLPAVWPMTPLAFTPGPVCAGIAAGGMLLQWNPLNFMRIYLTPTITGAIGTAICFGGPGMATGLIPPPGLSPLVPGGNCIVAAMPLFGCSSDGSSNDGDIGSQTILMTGDGTSGNKFFNSNSCTPSSDKKTPLDPKNPSDNITIQKVISYMKGNTGLAKEILNDAKVQHGGLDPNAGPLISIGGGDGSSSDLDVGIDTSALLSGNLGSVIKINYKRINSFPDFVMDWVTRQIEEVVNKLTTLPTIKIILPDFSSLADFSWNNLKDKYNAALDKIKKANDNKRKANDAQLVKDNKNADKNVSNSTLKDAQKGLNEMKNKLKNLTATDSEGIGGIRAAFQVISNLPLISISYETLDINIPWIGPEEIDKWITENKGILKQWQDEIDDKTNKWGSLLPGDDKNSAMKVLVDAKSLVRSIEKNIQTLEDIKKFPTKLRKYITWKEHFISQILCNVEIINKVLGGWISDNGKRFRAWVELIVLIKAILKSWQLIIDLFVEFNANCSVCHNERYNLLYFIIKLISALIPQIPVIQFPKWPDIVIDVHNIRAGINIAMPEFDFKPKPITLPKLPKLYLPEVPSVKIKLPVIPTLPALPDLPDLPDIPSLPDVKLPDLPPPPKIPKLFGAIEAVLQILKLLAKILCLWKKIGNLLPPEWKAGDSIAWLTERNGTLPIDKLFIDFPQFGMSFVDAIKVTSYVNLELNVDFIVEMARAVLEPFNSFANDVSNMGNSFKIPDIDLSGLAPGDVEVGVTTDGKLEMNNISKNSQLYKLMGTLAGVTVGGILELVKSIDANKKEYEVQDFKKILLDGTKDLASSSDPRERKIYDIIEKAVRFDGSSENAMIKDLINGSKEKFGLVKTIIENDRRANEKLNNELVQIENGSRNLLQFSPLQRYIGKNIKISSEDATDAAKKELLETLSKKQENRVLDAVSKFADPDLNAETDAIKSEGQEIIGKVKEGVNSLQAESKLGITSKEDLNNAYATVIDDSSTSGIQSNYSLVFNGIYVVNSEGKQSRLFDYTDELTDNSDAIELDYDGDGDEDAVYMMGNSIYLKTNMTKSKNVNHFTSVENIKDIGDINDFLLLKSEVSKIKFAPNFFQESFSTSNSINFKFIPGDQASDTVFRLEYYDYIDRFDRTNNDKDLNSTISPYATLNVVDMIPNLSDESIKQTTDTFISRNIFASFGDGYGSARVSYPDYKRLHEGDKIVIQSGKIIYPGASGLTIRFTPQNSEESVEKSIDNKTSLEFVLTQEVEVVSGEMILPYDTFNDFDVNDVSSLKGLPILPGTKVSLNSRGTGNIKISYSKADPLIIDNGGAYEVYNLGARSESYDVNLSRTNDFYYARMYSFSSEGKSAIADLTLLSPQFQADMEPPFISADGGIRVPVYKQDKVNLSKYINDTSGIAEVYLDMDLTKDTSNPADNIANNDKDTLDPDTNYGVHKGNSWFDLNVDSFNHLEKKKVRLYAKDYNGNTTFKDIDFEVYAPVPAISSVKDAKLISGNINQELGGEPIDVFRFRNGVMTRLDPKLGTGSKNTNEKGEFSFETTQTASGVVLKKNSEVVGAGAGDIAIIDETTGRIDIKDSNFSINVVPATESNRTALRIIDKEKGNIVFEQNFNRLKMSSVSEIGDFAEAKSNGIYVKIVSDAARFVKNTSNATSLPSGGFVLDGNGDAAVGIGIDGNVYVLKDSYHLTYDTYGGYVAYSVVNMTGDVIATILLKTQSEYLIK